MDSGWWLIQSRCHQVSSQEDWDLSESDRYKFWTDGKNGWQLSNHKYGRSHIISRSVFLGVEKCTKADEGIYRWLSQHDNKIITSSWLNLFPCFRCVISNRFGRREHKFKLFISSKFLLKPQWFSLTLLFICRIFCQESPLKKRGKVQFNCIISVVNPTSLQDVAQAREGVHGKGRVIDCCRCGEVISGQASFSDAPPHTHSLCNTTYTLHCKRDLASPQCHQGILGKE